MLERRCACLLHQVTHSECRRRKALGDSGAVYAATERSSEQAGGAGDRRVLVAIGCVRSSGCEERSFFR